MRGKYKKINLDLRPASALDIVPRQVNDYSAYFCRNVVVCIYAACVVVRQS